MADQDGDGGRWSLNSSQQNKCPNLALVWKAVNSLDAGEGPYLRSEVGMQQDITVWVGGKGVAVSSKLDDGGEIRESSLKDPFAMPMCLMHNSAFLYIKRRTLDVFIACIVTRQ